MKTYICVVAFYARDHGLREAEDLAAQVWCSASELVHHVNVPLTFCVIIPSRHAETRNAGRVSLRHEAESIELRHLRATTKKRNGILSLQQKKNKTRFLGQPA